MSALPASAAAAGAAPLALDGLCVDVGGRRLIDALTLTVAAGQRWVILGPNGAGKTTLLRLLAGLGPAAAGRLQLAGADPARTPPAALAAQRALVADRWLDPFAASALDTVLTARYRFGAADADGARRAREELVRMDCVELAGHDVRGLSRGERQRVALATALAQDTPLVLLDEPTAHQDPRHQALVLQRLARLAGRTWVASMHDVNAAAGFATHVLLLSGQGRWQAGPAAALLTADTLGALFGVPFLALPTAAGPLFHPAHG